MSEPKRQQGDGQSPEIHTTTYDNTPYIMVVEGIRALCPDGTRFSKQLMSTILEPSRYLPYPEEIFVIDPKVAFKGLDAHSLLTAVTWTPGILRLSWLDDENKHKTSDWHELTLFGVSRKGGSLLRFCTKEYFDPSDSGGSDPQRWQELYRALNLAPDESHDPTDLRELIAHKCHWVRQTLRQGIMYVTADDNGKTITSFYKVLQPTSNKP